MVEELDERARLWRGIAFGVGLSLPLWGGLIWGTRAILRAAEFI